MAQLAEQLTCNQQVNGSSPFIGLIYGWVPEWPKGADCKSVAIASKVRILPQPFCPSGGTGRRTGLKILRDNTRTGSIPVSGTYLIRAYKFNSSVNSLMCPDSSVGRAED